jgi:hypothetical protein
LHFTEALSSFKEPLPMDKFKARAHAKSNMEMKRYSIIVRPYGAAVEAETVLCQVDEGPEGVAQVIRAKHRYESVRVVENIERGELGNTQ